MQAICDALREGPGRTREVHVVLEEDRNLAHLLERDKEGRPRIATAQWNDDLHHAAHVLLTGERDGYYADYAQRPLELFARALAEGFVYQGQASVFREGETRGEPSAALPSGAFVSYLQTHDQVGNRAFGERIDALADPVLVRAARACLLLSPHTPMLFMGEEYAAATPFPYFCDFGPELAAAVSQGRRDEFGRFAAFADEAARAAIDRVVEPQRQRHLAGPLRGGLLALEPGQAFAEVLQRVVVALRLGVAALQRVAQRIALGRAGLRDAERAPGGVPIGPQGRARQGRHCGSGIGCRGEEAGGNGCGTVGSVGVDCRGSGIGCASSLGCERSGGWYCGAGGGASTGCGAGA